MSKLKVLCFSVSIDGFGAGLNQSLENPMGVDGMALHNWVFPTKSFQAMHGDPHAEGTTGIDNDFASKGFENIGAWILGRNMYGPIRGSWNDDSWKGWWGDNPPYHTPVYILTHFPHAPIEMEGGTTFYFVTGGIHEALEMAKESAKAKDIRLGGGVDTVRQYLQAQLVDEMHIAMGPVMLGKGENLWRDLDLNKLGYECTEFVPSESAVHLVFKRK